MVDSRAKNLFIGFSGSATDPEKVEHIDRKAIAEPYDMDTALGILVSPKYKKPFLIYGEDTGGTDNALEDM